MIYTRPCECALKNTITEFCIQEGRKQFTPIKERTGRTVHFYKLWRKSSQLTESVEIRRRFETTSKTLWKIDAPAGRTIWSFTCKFTRAGNTSKHFQQVFSTDFFYSKIFYTYDKRLPRRSPWCCQFIHNIIEFHVRRRLTLYWHHCSDSICKFSIPNSSMTTQTKPYYNTLRNFVKDTSKILDVGRPIW